MGYSKFPEIHVPVRSLQMSTFVDQNAENCRLQILQFQNFLGKHASMILLATFPLIFISEFPISLP